MINRDSKTINVFEPFIGAKDYLSVVNALYNKQISGSSSLISEFETRLKNTFNRKFAVTVSNGSIALDLALSSLNLNSEDEVIIPTFTIVSVLSAVLRSGAKPVFCDIEIDSWNMSRKNVEKLINNNTKAIVIVHTYGLTADAIEIEKLCKDKNLVLIEDAAEAHGQKVENRKCGSFGKVSILSFYANKHITTGEGGCLLTDDEILYNKFLQMKNLDFDNQKRFQHKNMFWNYRLGSLQAALGISQIDKMEKIIEKKMKQGQNYNSLLKKYSNLFQLPLESNQLSINHYWVYGIIIKKNISNLDIIKNLYNYGIETRPFFYPLHLQEFLEMKYLHLDLPNALHISKHGLYLPTGSHINYSKQKFIVEKLLASI